MSIKQHIQKNAVVLGIFAALTTTLIAGVYQLTAQKIADSQQQHLLTALNELVPATRYNNTLLNDTLLIDDAQYLKLDKPEIAYRARFNQHNVAVIFPVTAPNGYSGKIKLLVAINDDGSLAGVRVLSHKETAGLGDAIERHKSDWIDGFKSRSLSNTTTPQWRVKRDNGIFEQLTGATITPRAVVKAVHNSLLYYQQHKQQLFAPSSALLPVNKAESQQP